jgi:phage terminase small subunit
MSDQTSALSPRHELFVAEYLKHGNASRAYVRAGYAPRAAQTCGSRLLRDPRIVAAIAAGRQRIAEALAVDVERVTQEYARIAFARIEDFVATDDDGRVRIDIEKAEAAQRGGLLELRIVNKSKQEQSVTLKLGKLQALAALTKQPGGLAAKPAERLGSLAEDLHSYRLRYEAERRAEHAEQQLAEARAMLAAAGLEMPPPPPEDRPPAVPHEPEPPELPEEPRPPIVLQGMGPPDPPPAPPRPAVMPGMPTEPPQDCVPAHLNGRVFWNTDRAPPPGPTWFDAMRKAKPGGFPGW